MNPSIERFGPPALVLGIALYLGWAPAPPLDLGDDLVKVKAVRWKKADLGAPTSVAVGQRDPFAPVLEKPEPKQMGTTEKVSSKSNHQDVVLEPESTLTEKDLLMGLKMTGIATTDQRHWAIINGRIVSAGDMVPITGQREQTALITKVGADFVFATADGVSVQLKKTRRSERPTLNPEGLKKRASSQTVFPSSDAVKAAFEAIALPAMATQQDLESSKGPRFPDQP